MVGGIGEWPTYLGYDEGVVGDGVPERGGPGDGEGGLSLGDELHVVRGGQGVRAHRTAPVLTHSAV